MDQVRERARYLHYSLRTEMAYLYWIRWFIRWHGLRHPREMGAAEVEAFLSMLATDRHVSSSTHNQALSAVLFLYREVLGQDLPWMYNLKRPAYTRRIPVVLTQGEVQALLAAARMQWQQDRTAQRSGVEVPHALEKKYPKVGQSWGWFWMFPSPALAVDPRSGVARRHHLYEERLQRAIKKGVATTGIARGILMQS
jgi:hypothetical protein